MSTIFHLKHIEPYGASVGERLYTRGSILVLFERFGTEQTFLYL